MSKSFEQLKKQLNQFKEEKEMQDIITNLDSRKAVIKEEMKLHCLRSLQLLLKKLVSNRLVVWIVLKKRICITAKRISKDTLKVHLIWMHSKLQN